MKIDDEVTVRTEAVAHGGFVVARSNGIVLFVRLALPDELVKVKIIKSAPGGRAWVGEAIEILEASPYRITPRCEYFKASGCGGCDFQHSTIDYQLEMKKFVLIEQMQRLAKLEVGELIQTHQLSPKDFNWRSKVRLAPNDAGFLGYRKFRSHEIINIENCPIAIEPINQKIEQLSREKFRKEQIFVLQNQLIKQVNEKSDTQVSTKLLGVEFTHMASGFWQSHLQAAEKLASLVLAKVEFQARALDLYAGVGVFGRLLIEQQKISKLDSVELDKAATKCAIRNFRGLANARAISDRAERFLLNTDQKYDLVILDPPRKGLGEAAAQRLAKVATSQIIYVACDPASLARDSRVLITAGWHLSQLDLVDAFPQTHHLETVAVFSPEE